jgi:hypothetical protein
VEASSGASAETNAGLIHPTRYIRLLPNPLLFTTDLNYSIYIRFEVFTAVTMKNAVFWDVTPRGSCKNGRFGATKFLRNIGSYKSHAA